MIITTKPYGDFIYVAEARRGHRLLIWSVVRVGGSADELHTISRRQVPRIARRFVYQTRHRYRGHP